MLPELYLSPHTLNTCFFPEILNCPFYDPFIAIMCFFCLIWKAVLLIFSCRCRLVWELFQSLENLYAQEYHTLQVHCFFEQSRFRRETATLAPLVFHCSHIPYNLVSFKPSWYQCALELIYQKLLSFSRYGANVQPFLCSRVVWPALYHFNFLFLTQSFDLSFKFFSFFDWSVPGIPWTSYIFFYILLRQGSVSFAMNTANGIGKKHPTMILYSCRSSLETLQLLPAYPQDQFGLFHGPNLKR